MSKCSVDGCLAASRAKSFCQTHYLRWKKHGDPLYEVPRAVGCVVAGCKEKHSARGYCKKHWARWKRHGDPLVNKLPKLGLGRNPVAIAAAKARYREKHREELREKNRQYSKEHQAQSAEWKRRDKEKNRALYAAKWREYYEKNKSHFQQYQREWNQADPEKRRGYVRKRRAILKGCSASLSTAAWKAIKELHGNKCAYCGSSGKVEMDHIVPISRGGAHHESNVVPCCRSCNASKGDRPLEEWLSVRDASGFQPALKANAHGEPCHADSDRRRALSGRDHQARA